MDQLTPLARGYKTYFCFVQIKDVIFPKVPKSTLRSWMKDINVSCVPAFPEERDYLKLVIPNLSGAFGLLEERDLDKLLQLKDRKELRTKQRFSTSSPAKKGAKSRSISPVPAYYDQNSSEEDECSRAIKKRKSPSFADLERDHLYKRKKTSHDDLENNRSHDVRSDVWQALASDGHEDTPGNRSPEQFPSHPAAATARKHGTELQKATTPSVPVIIDIEETNDRRLQEKSSNSPTGLPQQLSHTHATDATSRDGLDQLETSVDTSPVSTGREAKALISNRGSAYRLRDSDMSPELRAEIKRLIEFYKRPLNPNRDGVPLASSTLEKLDERCRCFLYYVRNVSKSTKQLTLRLCNDTDLVLEYVNFLKDNRKLKPSTLSRIISVLISIVKFNYGTTCVDHSTLPEIVFLRRLQSQLERENRLLSHKGKEGVSKQARTFYHANILDALKSLRCKFEDSTGPQEVRHLHDFLIISLFVTVMPGRSKELRTLQIHDERVQGEFDKRSAYGKNFINFAANGSVIMFQTDYKTFQKFGPAISKIDHDDMLAYYLKLYLKKRPSLLLGKSHNYFFVSYRGESFSSSGPFSKYVSDIFEREVSIRAGTTALRHAILTYFNSLEESKDQSLRESLATLMKHSVRYQKTVYDDRSHEERTELGRKFMQEKISSGVFSDEEEASVLNETKVADSDDDECLEIPIRVNDICCLLDPVSTPKDIRIFVAKVARLSADRTEAYLMHLEKRTDSNNLYAFRPGDVWKESCKSLVYPVDIVYNPSENAYELRTTKQAIYESVRGNGL